MYDKQVRRRRLTLAGFVIASLLLLTVYFGESSSGGLHSAQRGALSFLSPVQEGAHRALKPFRDLFGWVGDTFDARKERDRLKKDNQQLTEQLAKLQSEQTENDELKRLLQINETGGIDAYAPVRTLVSSRNPSIFYSRVGIDKGSSAGIREGQPVVNGDGLVGRVSQVSHNASVVTLVTDSTFATGVKVLGSGQQTAIRPDPNRPGELELSLVQNPDKISRGDIVVTSGSDNLKLPSYYPRDIMIGKVSRIEVGEGNLDSRIHVKPSVDVGTLEWVEVLTKGEQGQTVASLEP